MKKALIELRNTVIAGLIFLLPILILLVLASKAVNMMRGVSTKIAGLFGLKTIAGVSAHTIVSSILLLVLCLLCGYLVRLKFFKNIYNWIDNKLVSHIPGYRVYREMAMSKLDPKEELLPYECSATIDQDGVSTPCFVMETLADGRIVVFIPTAGNVKEGAVYAAAPDKIKRLPKIDTKKYQLSISNLGLGMGELMKQE